MLIKNEDIIGFVIHNLMYCLNCAADQKEHEMQPVTEDNVKEDFTAVCDECENVILAN